MGINLNAVSRGEDDSLISVPYKVAILSSDYNKWWYPETSLELHKDRDEFISTDEYAEYLKDLFSDKD